MKPVLQIDKLIDFIEQNKKISFKNLNEKEDIKDLLNTYNFIKIFLCKWKNKKDK